MCARVAHLDLESRRSGRFREIAFKIRVPSFCRRTEPDSAPRYAFLV